MRKREIWARGCLSACQEEGRDVKVGVMKLMLLSLILGIGTALGGGGQEGLEEKMTYSPEMRQKAEAGDAEAQYELGVAYCRGNGIGKDLDEAVKWYEKSGEQGNDKAQCNLGIHRYKGEGGKRDLAQAVKWLLQAAKRGNAKAQLWLGRCYYKEEGLPQSDQEAIKWWTKSADQGNFEAAMYLKSMK